MTRDPTPDAVMRLFGDGVAAVQEVTSGLSEADWEMPACGRWNGTQTARHLLAVAHWYHAWLDRALAGDSAPPFAPSEMDEHNDAALADVGDISGPGAVAAFAGVAGAYLERAADHWDVAYGYPYGTVTVGLHCGVAATEWHLHAWDLSHTAQRRHEPQDAGALFMAAGRCLAAARGGLGGVIMRSLIPLGARRHPWPTIVKRSGRTPSTVP